MAAITGSAWGCGRRVPLWEYASARRRRSLRTPPVSASHRKDSGWLPARPGGRVARTYRGSLARNAYSRHSPLATVRMGRPPAGGNRVPPAVASRRPVCRPAPSTGARPPTRTRTNRGTARARAAEVAGAAAERSAMTRTNQVPARARAAGERPAVREASGSPSGGAGGFTGGTGGAGGFTGGTVGAGRPGPRRLRRAGPGSRQRAGRRAGVGRGRTGGRSPDPRRRPGVPRRGCRRGPGGVARRRSGWWPRRPGP